MSSPPLRLLAPWRTLTQGCAYLLWFGLPFLRPGGVGLLRLDLPNLTLELAGHKLAVSELFPVLLLIIVLLLFFLLMTLALGRVWCGWGCPQTALVDLSEWCARRLGIQIRAGVLTATLAQRIALHTCYLLLALLCGMSLLWYFIPPLEFFPLLFSGRLGLPAMSTLLAGTTLVYADLAFLRRLLCKEFCPYGRFQTALLDNGTLTLRFHPDEAHRCIRCGACVRSCPVGIDIRRGYQIECINCGRCLDACRRVMFSRRQSGIIRYTFGLGRGDWRALANPRMALVAVTLGIAMAILAGVLLTRAPATLKLARRSIHYKALADGRQAVFYTAYLHNRTATPQQVRLAATLPGGASPLGLAGPVENLHLAPGEHRKIDFAVTFNVDNPAENPMTVHLFGNDNRELAVAEAMLPNSLPMESIKP